MTGWQPIESAPKDGTVIDLWWQEDNDQGYRIPDCHFRDDDFWIDDSGNLIAAQYVSHWMPIPAPPEVTS